MAMRSGRERGHWQRVPMNVVGKHLCLRMVRTHMARRDVTLMTRHVIAIAKPHHVMRSVLDQLRDTMGLIYSPSTHQVIH